MSQAGLIELLRALSLGRYCLKRILMEEIVTGRKTFRLALIGPSFIYGRHQRGPRRGSEHLRQSVQCS